MNASRRTFLQQLSLIGAGALGVPNQVEASAALHERGTSNEAMGVLVDLTKCNGCQSCEAACREANGFSPPADARLQELTAGLHRRPDPTHYTVVNAVERGGPGREPERVFVKSNCLHCLEPACVSACLVKALEKQPNGAVTYDPWKCMGCRYCMVACPFQIPTYEYDNAWTPQMRKCTFCMQEGNPHAGRIPACVQACPMECLTYGRRSDLLALAHRRIEEQPDRYIDQVYGEREAGGTSWMYVSGVPFADLGFLQVDGAIPSRLAETIQHGVFKHFMPPVAWCGILGMAMWLTQPDARQRRVLQEPPPYPGGAGIAGIEHTAQSAEPVQ